MSNRVPHELPALELKKVSLKVGLRNKVSPRELTPEEADRLAAEVFDEALTASHIGTEDAARMVGVSKGLVSKWRSPHYTERPSYGQLLRLGPEFNLAMNRIVARRFGFARAALLTLMDAASDLALAVGE
jgi:hypothetical protein